MGEIQKSTTLEAVGKDLREGHIADTILSSMRDGLVIVDASGQPIWTNDAAIRMHGFRDKQRALREFERLLSDRGGYQVRDAGGKKLPHGAWPITRSARFEAFDWLEVTIVCEESSHGWTGSFSGLPVELPGGQRLFVMSCQDISDRKQTEIHLKETASSLEHLVEERAGAIRLLHDVTAACHRASTVGEALDLVLKLFSQFNGWCFGHAYLLASETPDILIPVEVDSKGLMKALEDLAGTTRELHGLDCHFECERPVAVDDNATATDLFYIVQEAVHNAVKHSNANHVFIQMKLDSDLLRLLVRDDGNGMDSVLSGVGGVGIRIMRHRAGVVGADLDIVSQPGSGTPVLCYLTLEHGQQNE